MIVSTFTENWANLTRWTIPSGKSVLLLDGKCYAAPGASNVRAELVEAAPGGMPLLFVQVDAAIQDGFSIRFFDPDGVFPLHEAMLVHEYGSIYLERYLYLQPAPVRQRLFALPAGQYQFRVGFTDGYLFIKVYSDATLIRYAELPIESYWEVHAIAVSPGQAVDPDSISQPWIGAIASTDGQTRFGVDALLGPEEMGYPALVAPDFPQPVNFREGAYASWTSPTFGGSGNLIFSTSSKLPPGIMLTANGSSLVLSGIPTQGTAGQWDLQVVVDDGLQPRTLTIGLAIAVASLFDVPGDVVTAESIALGDFYYQISGGPLRKEMTQGES